MKELEHVVLFRSWSTSKQAVVPVQRRIQTLRETEMIKQTLFFGFCQSHIFNESYIHFFRLFRKIYSLSMTL